jgi:hypothetical protein
MADHIARHRLTALAWVAVFLISGFLAGETIETMRHVGLFGTRPPLPMAQTILRILIIAVALGLLCVFRSALDRMTLLAAAAAAGSTALYGLGYRSAGLSAFRLLSHLAAYALAMVVASRKAAWLHTGFYEARPSRESVAPCRGDGIPSPQGSSPGTVQERPQRNETNIS